MAATPRNKPIRPVTRRAVRKADDDAPIAVYDQNGNLVGICDRKDITPITGADAPAEKEQPKPTRSAQTEAAAGEDPQLGIEKAHAAARQLKKQLYGSATAEEQAQLATAMNVAAADVLKKIQARRPRRRG